MSMKRKLAKMGRPSYLDDVLIVETILDCIRDGLTYAYAADIVGIDANNISEWKARGRQDIEDGNKTKYSSFYMSIKKARADFIQERLKGIKGAAKEHWQANAWLLERLDHKTFGKKESHEISNADNKPFLMGHGKIEDLKPDELSNEDLTALIAQIKKKLLTEGE